MAITGATLWLLMQFLRSVQSDEPTEKARYEEAFDIGILLDYILEHWPINSALSEADMRAKAILLVRITSLRRSKEISRIQRSSVSCDREGYWTFRTLGVKGDRGHPNRLSKPFPLFANRSNPSLCPIEALTTYMEMTQSTSKEDDFLFRWVGRDKPITNDTVRNICGTVMKEAGIPKKFGPHSLRMAAATKLLDSGMSVEDVMRIGDWTSTLVFERFYNRGKYRSDAAELVTKRR
jgi:integrase